MPQFVSAAIMNETLYVFFMNVGAVSDLCPPPGTIYYVSMAELPSPTYGTQRTPVNAA